MDDFRKKLPMLAREETRLEIPVKVRFRARLFRKQQHWEYLSDYYMEQASKRTPLYLPCIYMKEEWNYLCRYAGIRKSQVSAVLIDANDARTDYFLYEFLESLNYLTIVTERREYFENFTERAFQELGLLIDLVCPWEAKKLLGNLVWDFSGKLQSADCYPQGSICFAPCKNRRKLKAVRENCPTVAAVGAPAVVIGPYELSASLAESLLVPDKFPFRKSRCEELRQWCMGNGWHMKMTAQKGNEEAYESTANTCCLGM